jgi:hypothetical protein
MVASVRLFWWLVLIFAGSATIAVLTWTMSELVGGSDRAFDSMLDTTTLAACITAFASGLVLMIIGPGVFHDRSRETRQPPGAR